MTTTAPFSAPLEVTEPTVSCTLDLGGMTCASCVGRVEKALRRVPGVAAAEVNLATEAATVGSDPDRVGVDELTAAVTRAGYTATPRRETQPVEPTDRKADGAQPGSGWCGPADRAQAQVAGHPGDGSGPDGADVRAAVPGPMDWLMPAILIVATVVQCWAGADIYRAAWAAAVTARRT